MGAAVPPPVRVRISWQAPASCAYAKEFERALAPVAASPAIVATPSDREVRVRIEETADGVTGEVSLAEPGQEGTPRRVTGVSCREVVEALLFVTTLALGEPPSGPSPRPTSVVNAPPATLAVPERRRLMDSRITANQETSYALAGILGPQLQLATGLSAMFGAALAAQVELPHRIRPALRLEVSAGATPELARAYDGWLQLVLTAAKLEVSPGRAVWRRLRFGGAVALEVGELVTRGNHFYPLARRTLWLAMSENARIEARFRRGWFGELTLSLVQPLRPDHFADPEASRAAYGFGSAYKMPALGFACSLGVGYVLLGADPSD